MLFVCRESYAIAASIYTRAFSRRGESFPETYFNFEDDILFMDARVSWFKNILKDMDGDISEVSNLALRVEFSPSEILQGCPNEQTYKWMADVLSIFNKIKNLTLVLEQETHHCRSPCLSCWLSSLVKGARSRSCIRRRSVYCAASALDLRRRRNSLV
jgi:hypothetical protein